jgi:hypothetical protein
LRGLGALALAPLFAVLLGCVVEDQEPLLLIEPDASYEALFPHYVEICALSQVRPLNGSFGGSAGHAVMYLHGACRVEDAPYPTIATCSEPGSEAGGVGVSVNQIFSNVNWIATPGREMFFNGNVPEGELIDEQRFEAVLQEALTRDIYRGIQVHPRFLEDRPPERSVKEWIAHQSITTDFALRLGRSLFCSRLPMTEPMLEKVVDFLNGLNAEYASGQADYNWSGYSDNCAHLVHNALAAADVWKPRAVWTTRLRQLANLAIPANVFVHLAQRSNEFPIERFSEVYRDTSSRETLERFDRLPTRHGALLSVLPIYERNEVYDPTARLFILEGPLRLASADARRLLRTPDATELEANLQSFVQRYGQILADRTDRPLGDTEQLYYEVIERELSDVHAKLRTLNGDR